MTSDGSISSSEYMTILVKFPKDTFNLDITLDKTFDEFLNMANEGATNYSGNHNDYDNYNATSIIDKIFMGFTMIISFAFPVTIVVIAIIVAKKNGYGYINNKTISKKDTPFFREIPCNKDIYYAITLTNLNINLFSAY